ncbi:MAG: ribosome rescue GTPase HflX [Gammaproteobacteria bacterium]
MFERPSHGERAILVHIGLGAKASDEHSAEFKELATSAGAQVCALLTGTRKSPHARFFIGTGKLDELRDLVTRENAELVLFNHALSPSQERNLEAELKCRVLDRAGLILDIFAQRARSFEGKLQVELAQLRHLSTRLVRGWTHLERQKGGIGLRGPGETQLETDRRLIGARIRQLKSRLDKVQKQRDQGRRTRSKAGVPTVSLVGYTNAGKSTLFNSLTGADVGVADQLFATLDPTLRKVETAGYGGFVLADTVGFIRDLPHELVAAFRSTLQETKEASLLLHVVDVADPNRRDRIEQVNRVLEEIGADKVPQILVFNKIDKVGETPHSALDEQGKVSRIWLSAMDGTGTEPLLAAVNSMVSGALSEGCLEINPDEARIRALLFEAGAVVSETEMEMGGWTLEISLPDRRFRNLCRQTGLQPERLVKHSCVKPDTFLQSRTVA